MSDSVKTRDDLLSEARAEITVVDAERAEALIALEALILDVREPAEFQLGHLPSATSIPRGVLELSLIHI